MGSFTVQPYLAAAPTGAEESVTDHFNRFPVGNSVPTLSLLTGAELS